MIKSSCSLLLCFCFFVSLAGQKNLQPAELQTLDGAVIHGKIDYRNWDLNPKEILFFLNDESPEQKIRVLDIKGFSVQTVESKWEKVSAFLIKNGAVKSDTNGPMDFPAFSVWPRL